jgi:DnaJ-domain-containing protein 1
LSIPRRFGRLARGLALNFQDENGLQESARRSRERTENLKRAFKTGYETWKSSEEERKRREEGLNEQGRRTQGRAGSEGYRQPHFWPRKYPPEVARAYQNLGLELGSPFSEVREKRRELIKRYHPDRFSDPEKRARAERRAAEINVAHDVIARHLGR